MWGWHGCLHNAIHFQTHKIRSSKPFYVAGYIYSRTTTLTVGKLKIAVLALYANCLNSRFVKLLLLALD